VRLLILGASGGIGRHLVAQAIARHHTVTALVREGSRAPEGGVLVRGDVSQEGALESVLPGQDAVLSSLGIARSNPNNPWSALTSPPDFNSRVARRIVAAMQACGVPRVVAVSAAGVGDSAPRMNALMKAVVAWTNVGVAYRDLAVAEEIYATSGLDWCCVRPVALSDRAPFGAVRAVDHFGLTMRIARASVARWMLDRVASSEPGPRRPQIAEW
jgi:putative NADH-flavin reductase